MWWEFILGVLVGAAIPLITFLIQRRDRRKLFEIERKDKFKLAALDKRLEAHQKAYALCSKMLVIMDTQDETEVKSIINDGRKLLNEYSLYLGKNTRYKMVESIVFFNPYCPREKFVSKFDSNTEKIKATDIFIIESERIFDFAKVIQEEVELEPISMQYYKDFASK